MAKGIEKKLSVQVKLILVMSKKRSPYNSNFKINAEAEGLMCIIKIKKNVTN